MSKAGVRTGGLPAGSREGGFDAEKAATTVREEAQARRIGLHPPGKQENGEPQILYSHSLNPKVSHIITKSLT